MNILCIIPCSSKKIWDKKPNIGAVKARDAYTGSLSRKAIMFAEKFCKDSWVILSAKYGFLKPDDTIPGPYNITFKKKSSGIISIDELIKQAREKGLYRYNVIIVLAGKEYTNVVKKVFHNKKIVEPLKNLRYGEKLQKLNELLFSQKKLQEIISELSQ